MKYLIKYKSTHSDSVKEMFYHANREEMWNLLLWDSVDIYHFTNCVNEVGGNLEEVGASRRLSYKSLKWLCLGDKTLHKD